MNRRHKIFNHDIIHSKCCASMFFNFFRPTPPFEFQIVRPTMIQYMSTMTTANTAAHMHSKCFNKLVHLKCLSLLISIRKWKGAKMEY